MKFAYRIRIWYGHKGGTNPWDTEPVGSLEYDTAGNTWEECRRKGREQYYQHWKDLGYSRAPAVRNIECLASTVEVA